MAHTCDVASKSQVAQPRKHKRRLANLYISFYQRVASARQFGIPTNALSIPCPRPTVTVNAVPTACRTCLRPVNAIP